MSKQRRTGPRGPEALCLSLSKENSGTFGWVSLDEDVSVLRAPSIILKFDIVVHDNMNHHRLDFVSSKEPSWTVGRASEFIVTSTITID